jgi:hypothetical protein
MNWQTIVSIVLGSGLLSAIFSNLLDRFLNAREAHRYNKFIALTLAHDLEAFSWRCAELVSDHDTYNQSDGHAGRRIGYPPEDFQIPDESFKGFDTSILDRVYRLPLSIRAAKGQIDFWHTVVGDDEATGSAYKETLRLGKEAIEIALEIRKKYKLLIRPIEFGETTLQEIYPKKLKE